ncbi:hypothetical protein DRZ78_00665 [Candidatus Aerophobetes bacterium]|uniref:Periplasmic copper-binding protein NosD beta helix domain-containing protein n=1 Tax=Aerophobetes bacterium TaxID=2030807 RepID=A0A662D4G7_UNCAE|nr:MAG: hypothetical protein DRZ78_00665 [Candidatus Aerophobetes bacterium]
MIKEKITVKNLLLFLFMFIFSQITIFNGISNAFTTSGVLTEDEVWSGKIHITGDVMVPKGIKLTIQGGTIITFAPDKSDNDIKLPIFPDLGVNKCNLIIEGDLIIQGDRTNRVIITGQKRQDTLSWGGIIFKGMNIDSVVKYTIIKNAEIGLLCSDSSFVRLVGNIVTQNDIGIMTFDLSSAEIKDNRIQGNIICGIACYDYSRSIIVSNIISKNSIGILLEDTSNPCILQNKLRENFKDIEDNRKIVKFNPNNNPHKNRREGLNWEGF